MALNPANDVTFYCSSSDWLVCTPSLSGTLSIQDLSSNTEFICSASLEGTLVIGNVFNGEFECASSLTGSISVAYLKSNWIQWSKIGEFDFTQDRTNLAGEMPLDWKGSVYAIYKLGTDVIVYGSGGISKLVPVNNVYGKANILSLGIKSKGAVLGTDEFHIFITSDGCLWKLTDKLEQLGYDEYLSAMTSPIISYDRINKLAFICDGTRGYVYSLDSASMGTCPVNITGIGYQNGTSYVMSSGTISTINSYIGTGPVDFGNRNFKSINEVDLGIDFSNTVNIDFGIAFKNNSNGAFSSIIWFDVTQEGRVFPNVFGKEFQFYISADGSISKLHYVRLKGMFADYNPIDS